MNDKDSLVNNKDSKYSIWYFIVIGLGCVIFVLLLFAEKTPPLDQKKDNTKNASEAMVDSDQLRSSNGQTDKMPSIFEPNLVRLKDCTTRDDSLSIYVELSQLAFEKQFHQYEAQFKEEVWKLDQSDQHLYQTALAYKDASDFYKMNNQPEIANKTYEKAQQFYRQYCELKPDDLDAATDFALLQVSGAAPMKGILRLREIADANPNYTRAQLELGIFSFNTNQFEKALERFKNVLNLKKDEWEAYYYTGLIHEQKGKKVEAKAAFQAAMQYIQNEELKIMLETKIKNLDN